VVAEWGNGEIRDRREGESGRVVGVRGVGGEGGGGWGEGELASR